MGLYKNINEILTQSATEVLLMIHILILKLTESSLRTYPSKIHLKYRLLKPQNKRFIDSSTNEKTENLCTKKESLFD